MTAAQAALDEVCVRLDRRGRVRDGQRTTVGALAQSEPLRPMPVAPFPAEITQTRLVSRQALVAFRGNLYSRSSPPTS